VGSTNDLKPASRMELSRKVLFLMKKPHQPDSRWGLGVRVQFAILPDRPPPPNGSTNPRAH